ncbi:MAG: N-acetylmuramoyl-L-alanine amidase [Methylococcales bacterium]|jgi:N-acetylmuramoyl-L-alanine amidase|nr:N-acetylmuramoyl-L-alanine amidase [Methylococcales bacterium]
MRCYLKLFSILLSLYGGMSLAQAQDALRVNSLRYWNTPDQSRITFDVNAAASQNKIQFFDNPSRLVIDLPNAVAVKELEQPPASHPLFSSIRVGMRNGSDLRIVIDLKKPLSTKTTTLRTDILGTNRFIVELLDKGISSQVAKTDIEQKAIIKQPVPAIAQTTEKTTSKTLPPVAKAIIPPTQVEVKKAPEKLVEVQNKQTIKEKITKTFIVAIDAGHGGNDSGAQGPNGTYEKDVVFSIAKKLEALVNAQTSMKAVMIRQGDYYVGLRKRMDIARAAKADVFISVHADAIKDSGVKGASVYALSTSGASSESAYWHAHSENAADLVEGEQINDEENSLTNVLLDLSQSATQEASVLLANKVLHSFESVSELHFEAVQKAGFAVLKSPDIPSILVETAFISNPTEELKLLSSGHQLKLATAILKGINSYMKQPSNDQRIALL